MATAVAGCILSTSGAHAQQAITGNYTETFDSIGSGLSTGWSIYTGASATSLGTSKTLVTAATAWSNTAGQFSNYASDNIDSASDSATQAADTNRALGIRQTGAFGDPGAAFAFNFSTVNTTVSSLSIDLMTLADATRTTTWSIEYGLGSNPTSFTSLGTYTSGTFAATTSTFTTTDFSTNLNNQSSVWFRIVALTSSSGSGSRDVTAIDNFSLAAIYTAPTVVTWTGDGSGATWSNGGLGHFASNYSNSLSTVAAFTGSGETVTTSGTVQAGGLTFSSTNSAPYTIAGSGFELGASGISTTTDAVISAPISGTAGLTKSGAGNLTLSGTNTFSGSVTISAGKLIFGADANLGDVTNDIVLNGGTLNPTSSISLNAGRDISGSGTIEIGSGNSLTFNGTVNMGAMTLSDAGSLVLAGASNAITSLTVGTATTISITGGALSTSGITTTHTTGATTVSGTGLALGAASAVVTVADGSANSDLLISTNITSSGSARIQKRGAGTLQLTGDNSGLIGIQIGSQGATPLEGGRVLVNAATALGNSQLQANYGTLEASSAIVPGISVSIGGRSTGYITFTGSDMTFTGTGTTAKSNSFFKATGTTGELRFNVNNTTTLDGTFAATSGTGTATGITAGGTGTLVINGNASAITEKWTISDTLTFTLGASGALGSGGLEIGSGATLVLKNATSLDDTIQLSLTSGSFVTLNFSGTETIGALAIDGVFLAQGSYTLADFQAMGSGVTFTGDTGASLNVAAVPEPQTCVLAAMGLFFLVFALRRRRSTEASRA